MNRASIGFVVVVMTVSGCQKKHHTPYEKAAGVAGESEFFEREQQARAILLYDTFTLIARAEAESADAICRPSSSTWECVTGHWDSLGMTTGEVQGWQMVDPLASIDPSGIVVAPLLKARALVSQDLGESGDWRLMPSQLGDQVEVWGVELGQSEGEAWVGGTRRWLVDPEQGAVVEREEWPRPRSGVPIDASADVWLPSSEPRHPLVSELFFALYYRADLASVGIETTEYRIGLEDLDGTLGWSRALRE